MQIYRECLVPFVVTEIPGEFLTSCPAASDRDIDLAEMLEASFQHDGHLLLLAYLPPKRARLCAVPFTFLCPCVQFRGACLFYQFPVRAPAPEGRRYRFAFFASGAGNQRRFAFKSLHF